MHLTSTSKLKVFLSGIFFALVFLLTPSHSHAAVLLPGNINTCGELAAPGTYTLTSNVSNGTSTCFTIGSDNITLNGGGFTISASATTSAPALDGRARTGGPTSPLSEGANAYTNLIINDITLSGFTTGINLSGNNDTTGSGINNGYGGDAGDLAIYYSKVGTITSQGGSSSSKVAGGLGGNVAFTDTNLDISNSTISLLGGQGTSARNTNGGLALTYSGTLTKTNVSLSSLSFFNDNTTSYGVYPGGTFPIAPGNISSCGTLYGPGTFTLTQNISNIEGTCFTLASSGITIAGAGYSITSATSSNTSPAIVAGSYSSTTLASTTVSNFPNLITSTADVTISNNTLNFTNQNITAGSLTLNYTTLIKTGATISALTSLTTNGTNLGAQSAGSLLDWVRQTSAGSRQWRSITSSSDGTKLAAVDNNNGYIYTSTNSGVTWTQQSSAGQHYWYSITSSSDGTKLAAVDSNNGYIYTSTNSGVTWTAQTSAGTRGWRSITSSSDGTKLAAVDSNNGYIYTSTNSGVTWTEQTSSGQHYWYSITSSSDGTKLAAVDGSSGYIYTSTNSGVTWTAETSAGQHYWISITSSSDGTKLAAVDSNNGYIYTSTNSGVTWTEQTSAGQRQWFSITSSSDGTKLAAVNYNGYIYTSTNSGVTWTAETSAGQHYWISITSSSDGTKLAAVDYNNYIFTHVDDPRALSVDILTPQSGSTQSTWSPIVSWGTATSCYYSYNNFTSTSTANCNSLGSDIPNPGYGANTLYVKGIDTNGVVVAKSVSFANQLPITITAPVSGSTVTSWAPSINFDPLNAGNITTCQYSYTNFQSSTSTVNCANNGSDILPPANGTSTLSIRAVNSNGDVGYGQTSFTIDSPWTQQSSAGQHFWYSITSSSDGTKLAAVDNSNGYIYTSTNSGVTWTQQTSAGSRPWRSITSSSDGTKLAAIVINGYIYTSTNFGVTWTEQTSSGQHYWYSITSSSDGTKLAAVDNNNGYIYTSTNSGVTWTAETSAGQQYWTSITSSSDGTKLAAVVINGYIYTSSNSGVTWTEQTSSGQHYWYSITSSSDGTKLAAVDNNNGYIYTSTNSGVTWTEQSSSGQHRWYSIASSADGTKLAAVDNNNGYIYTSTNSGVTWTQQSSAGQHRWYSITSSSDGTKLAAVDGSNGYIYTYYNPSSLSAISIVRPIDSSSVPYTAWSPLVNWGSSVTCSYSYNNFASSTSVNCGNNGSDILAPTVEGNTTLYIRGVDGSNVVTNVNVSFVYNGFIQQTSAGQHNWSSIASSADGTKLAAVVQNYGYIYTSTDSGATWTQRTSSGQHYWYSITSSSDGTKLAAVDGSSGYIYTSTNSGVTWTAETSAGQHYWISITSSSDGTKLAAVDSNNGYIYTSTNSGVTWTEQTSAGQRQWFSITSSSDGTKLAAVNYNGYIYTSTNSGVTWTEQTSAGSRQWRSITSSSDGTKLAAVDSNNGYIYTSTNSGVTWTQQTSSGQRYWRSITSSADGTKLAAVVINGYIYTSSNSGVTWTAETSAGQHYWYSITSSSDGTKLAAVDYNYGYIYTYSALNPTLSVSILTPQSNTIYSVSPLISWGTATSCYYSFNNFTSTSTANCNSLGSDITIPQGGNNTLSIRGINGSNISTASVTFNYLTPVSGNTLTSCGVINTSGTYTLSSNITGVTGTCFVVNANDVTINGGGFTISGIGNSSYAVQAGNSTNLTLQDITFVGFGGLTSSNQGVTYTGTNVDLSNSTSTVGSLTINYTSALTTLNTYFSNLTALIINNINFGSWIAGLFNYQTANISSCTTLSSPGTYTLTQDITGIAGTCFTITSDRVIIDGNGHTITATGGNTNYAIITTATDANAYGAGIKNLTLVGFAGGVDARGADGTSGTVTGKNGGNITLDTVTFPTNTTSVNASGGNGYDDNTTANTPGNGGTITIINSVVGGIIANGGNAGGDPNPGYDNGTVQGGLAGSITNTNSSIATSSAQQGVGYIPGCTDNSFGNYNSLATYDDGSCTSLAIGSERDNPLGNTVSGPLDFNYFRNYGTVTGDTNFYIYNTNYNNYDYSHGGNYGTTTGYATFNDGYSGSGFGNYGYVGGGAYFALTTENRGTVNGDATFEYGSNYGTINGTAYFNLDKYGFGIYNAYNYGTINGDAYFYSNDDNNGYYNQGTVTGTIYNTYGCSDTSAINYDNATYDNGTCVYYGSNSDLPQGTTYTGNLTFDNSYSNYGTVNGNGEFYTNDGSANFGTTTGNATFYGYDTQGTGVLHVDGSFDYYGTGIVGGTIFDTNGDVITSVEFSNGQSNAYVTNLPVTFLDSSYNNGIVIGDATFLNSSFNQGTVNGNTTLNTTYYGPLPTTSTLTLSGNAEWRGTTTGTIYASDGTTPITNFAFTGNSSNYTTITGNPTFSGSTQHIGTIVGTATLTGSSQTITGSNSVTSLTKTSSGRDTLYLQSGQTTSVSGLTTLKGADANNLLTLRSTTPGTQANIAINGSHDLNFLRLKDIHNTGATIDLSSFTVFDDGGNSGFIFPSNSTPSGRGGITGTQSTPSLPPSRGGVAPSSGSSNSTPAPARQGGGSTATRTVTPTFTPGTLSPITLPTANIGRLTLPTLPTFGGTSASSFSFASPLANFLFKPLPAKIQSQIKDSPTLQSLLKSKGIIYEKDVAQLGAKPLTLVDTTDLFTITDTKGKSISSTLTLDKGNMLTQKISIKPNTKITVSFNNTPVDFSKSSAGTYTLKAPNAPLNLTIVIEKNTPSITTELDKPKTFIQKVLGWFGWR